MASANDPSHTPANAVAAMAAAMKKRKIDEEHLDAPAAKCPFQETSSHGNVTSPVTDQARQSNRPKRFASLKRKREKFIKEQNIVAPALEVSSTGLQTGPHQDRNQPSPTSHDTSEHCEEETHCHSSKRPRTNDPSPTKPPSGAQTSATVCSAQPSTAHHLSASAATKSSNGLKSKAQCCKFSHYSTTRGRRSTRRVPPTETLSNGTPQNPQVGTCAHANIHRTEALKPSPSVLSAQNEPVSGKAKAKPSVLGVSSTSKTNMKSANPSDIVADRIERGQALTTLFPDTRSTQQLARTQFPAGISIDEHPELDQRSIKEWEAQRAMDIEDREDRARRRDQIRRRNRLRNDERDAKAFEAQMQYPTTAHSQSHTWKQNPPSLQRHFLPCYKGVLKTQQRKSLTNPHPLVNHTTLLISTARTHASKALRNTSSPHRQPQPNPKTLAPG